MMIRIFQFLLIFLMFSVPIFGQNFEIHSIELESLLLNTRNSEFGAVEYEGKIVFCSNRTDGKRAVNKRRVYGVYLFDSTNYHPKAKPVFLSDKIMSKFNDGPLTFTSDGKTMYLTRNNMGMKRLTFDKTGVSQMQVYELKKEDGNNWSNPQKVSFNVSRYSSAHATISKDGKTVVFSSNRKKGKGLTDLWLTKKTGERQWSEAENLGDKINTRYQEFFPFLDDKGNLYFSSKGHGSMGKMDIFVVKDFLNGGNTVEQLPEPINSRYDDFSFIIYPGKKYGYLASNRPGGKGGDDVYKFLLKEKIVEKKKDDSPIFEEKKTLNPTDFSVKKKEVKPEIKKSPVLIPEKFYRIQVLALYEGKEMRSYDAEIIRKAKNFMKTDYVYEEFHEGYEKFLIGKWKTFDDALSMLDTIRKEVIYDAFIVEYVNGKRYQSFFKL